MYKNIIKHLCRVSGRSSDRAAGDLDQQPVLRLQLRLRVRRTLGSTASSSGSDGCRPGPCPGRGASTDGRAQRRLFRLHHRQFFHLQRPAISVVAGSSSNSGGGCGAVLRPYFSRLRRTLLFVMVGGVEKDKADKWGLFPPSVGSFAHIHTCTPPESEVRHPNHGLCCDIVHQLVGETPLLHQCSLVRV